MFMWYRGGGIAHKNINSIAPGVPHEITEMGDLEDNLYDEELPMGKNTHEFSSDIDNNNDNNDNNNIFLEEQGIKNVEEYDPDEDEDEDEDVQEDEDKHFSDSFEGDDDDDAEVNEVEVDLIVALGYDEL